MSLETRAITEVKDASRVRRQRAGKRILRVVLVAWMAIAFAFSAWTSWQLSPTWDEAGHLGAGLYHWNTGKLDAYDVNPPIPRLWLTLPLAGVPLDARDDRVGGEQDQSSSRSTQPNAETPPPRKEWSLASAAFRQHGANAFKFVSVARLMNLPLLLLGAVLVYRWCERLLRADAGHDQPDSTKTLIGPLLAAALFVGGPFSLSGSVSITPDLAATVAGLWANYRWWIYLKRRNLRTASWAGFAIGLAIATKTTWILMLPVWLLVPLWPNKTNAIRTRLTHIAVAAPLVWLTLCASYGFQGVGQPLNDFAFQSHTLTSSRFVEWQASVLGDVSVPLPASLVTGVDRQQAEFETGFPAYLCGEHTLSGIPWFYPTLLLFKWPLTWITLLIFAITAALRYGESNRWILVAVPVVLVGGAMWKSGITNHIRYVGPIAPYGHILLALWVSQRSSTVRLLTICLLIVGGVGVLVQVPQFIGYANVLARVAGGREHVFGMSAYDSTLDWGQNLLLVRRWLDEHPDVRLSGITHNHIWAVVEAAGLPTDYPPERLPPGCVDPDASGRTCPVRWYAVSSKALHDRQNRFQDFRIIEPQAKIGGTFGIYRVPPQD